MKILLVGAGASYSTKDVENGYRDALLAAGHDVGLYALDNRIAISTDYLWYVWRKAGKPPDKPTFPEIVYHASSAILERALRHEPDWVVVVSGMYVHPDWLVLLRRAGIRTAILFTESPYDDVEQARVAPFCDVCFTNERSSVAYLRHANRRTHYLAHAYDPARHHPGADGDPDLSAHDVVFVGTGFAERCETLASVDWRGIDLGLYGQWPLLAPRGRLRRYVRGKVVPNEVAAGLYRRASVGLNLYRTSMGFGKDAPRVGNAESLNPRALELAACGVFTLSDYRAEVGEVFGDAVPTFRTPDELGELVRYYLAHEDERRERAAAMPACVAGHTYRERAEQLVQMLDQTRRLL
jgi:spore maturation protein CgeB